MECNRNACALILTGVFLAVGMSSAAFILGGKLKTVGDNRQSIVVKGLAEKPVQADLAEWSLGIQVKKDSFADTLAQLRASRPIVDRFLEQQGFPKDAWEEGIEEVNPNMVEEFDQGHYRQKQQGFAGTQMIRVRSKDLARVAQAHKNIIQLAADGKPVLYYAPQYLIQDLESVKMSLIGAATDNARQRAEEFAKVGRVGVGLMRSASQGAFYILPADSDGDVSDYGGVYDKSSVAKKARVVVTITYGIE